MIYMGIGPNTGNSVDEDDAQRYAMQQCGITVDDGAPCADEFREMLVEWFYSGNWKQVPDD